MTNQTLVELVAKWRATADDYQKRRVDWDRGYGTGYRHAADELADALTGQGGAFHDQCHDLVCNGNRRMPRGAEGSGCSCRYRDNSVTGQEGAAPSPEQVTFSRALVRRIAAYVRGFTVPPPSGSSDTSWVLLQQVGNMIEAQEHALIQSTPLAEGAAPSPRAEGRQSLADAWWAGRLSVKRLPFTNATGHLLRQACLDDIAALGEPPEGAEREGEQAQPFLCTCSLGWRTPGPGHTSDCPLYRPTGAGLR